MVWSLWQKSLHGGHIPSQINYKLYSSCCTLSNWNSLWPIHLRSSRWYIQLDDHLCIWSYRLGIWTTLVLCLEMRSILRNLGVAIRCNWGWSSPNFIVDFEWVLWSSESIPRYPYENRLVQWVHSYHLCYAQWFVCCSSKIDQQYHSIS